MTLFNPSMMVYFTAKGFGLLILLLSVFTSNAENGDSFALRINCGSTGDFGYSGGVPFAGSPVSISPFPISTGRIFPKSFGPLNCYKFSVPRGTYSIRVFFGVRGYDNPPYFVISIKGTIAHTLSQDWSDWDEETFVEVLQIINDEEECICFHKDSGSPTVMSIELSQLPKAHYFDGARGLRSPFLRVHTRLNFGASESSFEQDTLYGQRFWKRMSRLGDNVQSIHTDRSIRVTGHYPTSIYNSAVIATPEVPDIRFFIRRMVPHKDYIVIFHFCQINGSIGDSVFDIKLDSTKVFKKLDLLEIAGRPYTSVTVNCSHRVTGTSLMVYLKAEKGSVSFINAIELVEMIEPRYNTFSLEVSTLVKMKSLLQVSPQLGWNGDPCSPERYRWTGIQCSFDQKQRFWFITTVSLPHRLLKGSLPDDVSNLSKLRFLNLSFNEIGGGISALGSIKTLEQLDLSNNNFNGSIPSSFERLPQLTLFITNTTAVESIVVYLVLKSRKSKPGNTPQKKLKKNKRRGHD
ncbi:hypothetical protein LguiB_034123 [Lonicera macranthoides]